MLPCRGNSCCDEVSRLHAPRLLDTLAAQEMQFATMWQYLALIRADWDPLRLRRMDETLIGPLAEVLRQGLDEGLATRSLGDQHLMQSHPQRTLHLRPPASGYGDHEV